MGAELAAGTFSEIIPEVVLVISLSDSDAGKFSARPRIESGSIDSTNDSPISLLNNAYGMLIVRLRTILRPYFLTTVQFAME